MFENHLQTRRRQARFALPVAQVVRQQIKALSLGSAVPREVDEHCIFRLSGFQFFSAGSASAPVRASSVPASSLKARMMFAFVACSFSRDATSIVW